MMSRGSKKQLVNLNSVFWGLNSQSSNVFLKCANNDYIFSRCPNSLLFLPDWCILPLRADNRMLLSAAALVLLQSSGSSFCHQNTWADEMKHTVWRHYYHYCQTTGCTVHSSDHVFVLQVVIGIGYDGLWTSVQQFFNTALVLPPSGGTEEVQAEAP